MANEIESKIDKAVSEAESRIKQYEERVVGWKDMGNTTSAYLTMNVSDIASKPVDEIVEIQSELRRYSLHVQRCLNTERSWERWFNSKSNELAALFIEQLQETHGNHYGWNERELIARNKPQIMQAINERVRDIKMKIDRLAYMPDLIQKFADSINDVKFAKMRKEKHLEQ